jgi:hypothetical protein
VVHRPAVIHVETASQKGGASGSGTTSVRVRVTEKGSATVVAHSACHALEVKVGTFETKICTDGMVSLEEK